MIELQVKFNMIDFDEFQNTLTCITNYTMITFSQFDKLRSDEKAVGRSSLFQKIKRQFTTRLLKNNCDIYRETDDDNALEYSIDIRWKHSFIAYLKGV
jgi:hypothetical protein